MSTSDLVVSCPCVNCQPPFNSNDHNINNNRINNTNNHRCYHINMGNCHILVICTSRVRNSRRQCNSRPVLECYLCANHHQYQIHASVLCHRLHNRRHHLRSARACRHRCCRHLRSKSARQSRCLHNNHNHNYRHHTCIMLVVHLVAVDFDRATINDSETVLAFFQQPINAEFCVTHFSKHATK
jgi:hypothetical protein